MAFQLPQDPKSERRARLTGWITFALMALLVALLAYLGYVGYEGSRQLTDAPNDTADCRTPAAMGWAYESINYDIETDAALQAEGDPTACAAQGEPAGEHLTSADGTRLAGWYVPAGNGSGPEGPTVVLAHGWGGNKSNLLDRAAVLHDAYNLVLFDFRNHGQSQAALTTQGVREADDVRAMIDWLVSRKAPDRIAVLGESMGGASVLNEAAGDDRVDALVIESTHATLANAAQARLDQKGYPLSMPGSWAILLGTLVRTGEDVTAADPIQAIARLDERPVLLIYGAHDASIGPSDAQDMYDAARDAGTPAELHVCGAAEHGGVDSACPDDYPDWVLGFLERVLASAR